MFFQSRNPQLTRVLANAMLAALSARPAGPLLATPKVQLWTGAPVNPISLDSVVGDFTVCTFTGYADATLPALSGPVAAGSNVLAMIGGAFFSLGTPIVTTQNADGYIVVDTTLAILYAIEQFPTPVPFALAGAFLDLVVQLPLACRPIVSV